MRSRGMIPARRLPQARTSVRCARAQQQRTSWAEAAGLAASMRALLRDTQNLLGKVGSSPTELPQVIIIATSPTFPYLRAMGRSPRVFICSARPMLCRLGVTLLVLPQGRSVFLEPAERRHLPPHSRVSWL